MKTILISLLLFCVVVLPLAGCNTVNGIGQDMSAAGRKVSGASN
jgi:predicted small secreted protein